MKCKITLWNVNINMWKIRKREINILNLGRHKGGDVKSKKSGKELSVAELVFLMYIEL